MSSCNSDWHYLELLDIGRRIQAKELSSVEATRAQLARIEQFDGGLRSYARLMPDSALADDGLYFAALAAQQLKNCTEARTYLGLVKQKYPKGNVVKQSDELDKQIKKDLKNKAKCAS